MASSLDLGKSRGRDRDEEDEESPSSSKRTKKSSKSDEPIQHLKFSKPPPLLSLLVHALLGTAIFTTVSSLTSTSSFGGHQLIPFALSTGLLTTAIFFWSFTKAGAHFNPVATFYQWFLQFGSVAPGISAISVLLVIIAQILGGIGGAGIALGFRGDESCVGSPHIGHVWGGDHEEDESEWRVFFALTIGNAVLLAAWWAVEHGRKVHPIVVGIVQTLLVFTFFTWGGAAFNPATSFGQYVVTGFADKCGGDQWYLPILGNFAGGLVGSVIIYVFRYLTNRWDYVSPVKMRSSSKP
jgi:glycerol uptake facilitator-like aquaporin